MTSHSIRSLCLRMRFAVLATIVAVVFLGGASVARAAEYDPTLAISNDNMRDYNSLSEKAIQTFLDGNKGPLKSLVTTDYAGVEKPASRIIYEAAQAWRINPKVLLVTLQKEQSLIETLTNTRSLERRLMAAMGAGVYDSNRDGIVDHKYPGFGRQVWYAALLLDKYGEAHDTSPARQAWATTGYRIYDYATKAKVTIYPKNVATFKLYVYTPYSSGPKTTATLYTRYFGSPLASPRYKPVYRFRSKRNGTYIYTTSIAEQTKLRAGAYPKRWIYEGAKFSVDTSVAASATTPLYRFRNKKTGKYSFTVSKAKHDYRRSELGQKTWSYNGVAFRIAKKASPGALTVWKFKNLKTGAYFFTHSPSARDKFSTQASYQKRYRYEGVAFYLPRLQTP